MLQIGTQHFKRYKSLFDIKKKFNTPTLSNSHFGTASVKNFFFLSKLIKAINKKAAVPLKSLQFSQNFHHVTELILNLAFSEL